MRLTIQRKVFLASFALALATVLVLVLATRLSLEQGFARYTASAELARLVWLVPRLEAAYARQGSWDFLKGNFQEWRSLHRPADSNGPRPRPDDGPPHGPGDAFRPGERGLPGDEHPPEDRPPPPNDPLRLGPRLSLQDAQGHHVVGREANTHPDAASLDIHHQGRVVGRVLLEPHASMASALDQAFLTTQTRNLVLTGVAALALSLLAAWLLARHLLAPIRELAAGARRISGGERDVRIPVRQGDELGELSADFNAMAEQLGRLEEARRAWVSDTSHELRTPLAVLRAEIEALQDGVRQPDEATLARLLKQVQQLARLVDDLRATMDLDGLGKQLHLTPLAPLPLLEEAVAEFRERFATAGLGLELKAGEAAECRLQGDADRLHQVFLNLLENSLRYTHRGGRLRIGAHQAEGQLTINFEDSAPGPSPEALPRLFERFFRAEPSRSRAHGGSGLGLAICKTIIEAHGGRIFARASDLGGLAILIQLPVETRP